MSRKSVAFFSRPVLTGASTGTGISACALRIYQALEKAHSLHSYTVYAGIPPYHSIFSVLVYDFLSPLIFLLRHFRQRFDTLFFIEPSQAIWIGLLVAWYKPQTVCVLVHDCFYLESTSPYALYSKALYQKAISHSNTVLTTTDENAELIRRLYGRTARVLPLGPSLDSDSSNLSDMHSEKLKQQPLRIGYIGSSVPRKRLLSMQVLIKKLAEDKILTDYVLAGPIDQAVLRALKTTVEAHTEYAELTYLGCIPESNKPKFYRSLHLLFFPTSLEGYGIPVVEAAYFGLPCFVFQDAKLPHFIKDLCFEDTHDFVKLRTFATYSREEASGAEREIMAEYQEKISRNQAVVHSLDWGRFAEVI